jgi:amino acid transporter
MPTEDRKERVDRELIELLNELRVALPGVQVLFAFLLVVPFQQGFANVTEVTRLVYFAGLASSALAIAFLITPATYHRINLRRGVNEKEEMLFTSSRLTLIGTAFLAAGIACSMYVIADVLFGDLVAIGICVITAAVIVALWYVLPLRARNPTRADETPD